MTTVYGVVCTSSLQGETHSSFSWEALISLVNSCSLCGGGFFIYVWTPMALTHTYYVRVLSPRRKRVGLYSSAGSSYVNQSLAIFVHWTLWSGDSAAPVYWVFSKRHSPRGALMIKCRDHECVRLLKEDEPHALGEEELWSVCQLMSFAFMSNVIGHCLVIRCET